MTLMLPPIHEQRYVCALCEAAPGKCGPDDGIPMCLRCRTAMVYRPRVPLPDMPKGPLQPHEIIARDAMLAAHRGA